MRRYEKENKVTYNGVGVMGLLGVVFITLRLCGVIDWSWWLVLLPLYGGFAVFLVCFIIALVIALLK